MEVSRSSREEEAAAVQRARAVLQPFSTPPPIVAYLSAPDIVSPVAAAADRRAAVTCTDVLLIPSPYPRRRATLAFLPYDDPVDGAEDVTVHEQTKPEPELSVTFVQPDPLPREADRQTADAAASPLHPVLALCRAIPRSPSSPYNQLSYVFGDACCPFTALFATLRAAGFTRVEGRKALLHKTHSLLWVKHLLPSMVDQLMTQLAQYRKVNHFPGSHWLGRKDKLCLVVRRAEQRWSRHTVVMETKNDIVGTSAEAPSKLPTKAGALDASLSSNDGTTSSRDMHPNAKKWKAFTPPTWLLPQDAEVFQRALRKSCATGASRMDRPNLYIVKPANSAGGQGIFLLDAGKGERGAAAAEATLSKAGAIAKAGLSSAVPAVRKGQSSAAAACFTIDPKVTADESSSSSSMKQDRNCFVVQQYQSNPFLICGHKFDLRLYVVVTSYDPVRVYLYKEGLVRIASAPYRAASPRSSSRSSSDAETMSKAEARLADVEQLRAHLTNFTVNKPGARPNNECYEQLEKEDAKSAHPEAGMRATAPAMETKWSLSALEAYMQGVGYDWHGTQQRVHEVLRKTFLSVTPEVRAELHAATRRAAGRVGGEGSRSVRANSAILDGETGSSSFSPPPCTANGIGPFFEFFGVDVLLVHDEENEEDLRHTSSCAPTLRPVLLEVNILPSLSTHYSLFDQRVKANFIADALTLVGLTSPLFKSASPAVHHTTSEAKNALDWIEQTFPDDRHAREACYTAAEEHRRGAASFTPLLPTPDSATRYAPLTVDDSLGVTMTSRYDAVLSLWAATQ